MYFATIKYIYGLLRHGFYFSRNKTLVLINRLTEITGKHLLRLSQTVAVPNHNKMKGKLGELRLVYVTPVAVVVETIDVDSLGKF